jgi:hypothetical protein
MFDNNAESVESVAEHSFRVAILAMLAPVFFLLPEIPITLLAADFVRKT